MNQARELGYEGEYFFAEEQAIPRNERKAVRGLAICSLLESRHLCRRRFAHCIVLSHLKRVLSFEIIL